MGKYLNVGNDSFAAIRKGIYVDKTELKEFGSYRVRTESSKSLKRYLDWDPEGLKEAVADLLSGKKIRVDVGTFLNDMTGIHNKDEVITLLIHLGYLTYDSEDKTARIRYEFLRAAS